MNFFDTWNAQNSQQASIISPPIRKCPWHVYPFKPHLYIVKLGLTVIPIFFLIVDPNSLCFEQKFKICTFFLR